MNDSNSTAFLDDHASAVAAAARTQLRRALDDFFSRDESNPDLDRAIARLREAAVADAQVTVRITEAQLDAEVHNRMAVVAELQALNEKLLQAKAEADALRLQLQRSADRSRPAPAPDVTAEQICGVLDGLRESLSALEGASNGARLLTAMFELVGERFARVALCAAESNGFVVWRSRGFDPALPNKTVLRVASDSPLARAAAEWTAATTAAAPGQTIAGVLGAPVAFAIALPIVARGRGSAILYAENLPQSATAADNRVAGKIVELLAEYVRPRVQIKQAAPTAVPESHAVQRRARRVKMVDGTTVVVDDSEGRLVDLSSLGAQVLSPRAMRPDSPVRLVLPSDAGGVACTGRVVWVVVEQQANAASALYRAGVQFTDVKSGELEGFLDFFDSGIRH